MVVIGFADQIDFTQIFNNIMENTEPKNPANTAR